MTSLERRAVVRLWRALVPERPGFEGRDLEASLALLLETLPPRGRLGLRAAALAATALAPTFGARPLDRVLEALSRHRLHALRQVYLLLKGTLFLAAFAREETRAACGVDPLGGDPSTPRASRAALRVSG